MPATRPSRPPLTTTDVGKLTRPPVSSDTVLREIRAGRLQATTSGGYRLVDPDEAARWAAAYRRGAHQRNPRGHRSHSRPGRPAAKEGNREREAASLVVQTKITFPAEGPGEARIRVYPGGNLRGPKLIVGACVSNGRTWEYTLWSRPGEHVEGDETGNVRTLKELGGQLQGRIGEQGNWWH